MEHPEDYIAKAEMIKQPALHHSLHPLLASRWSPRAYDGRPVSGEVLGRIFEAARWAPSSSNLQPWSFLLGFKGDEVFEGIYSTLVEFNQLWAGKAPVLGLALGNTVNPKGEKNSSYLYDLGAAMALLSIQATHEGVYVHQMGGFDKEKAAQLFGIPNEYEVFSAFTLGYAGNPEELHPNLKKLEYTPRSRKDSGEFVFTGKFGQKAFFL